MMRDVDTVSGCARALATLFVLCGGALWASPTQAQTPPRQGAVNGVETAERNCVDRPIEKVELRGCLGTRCQDPKERKKFIALLDLKPGEVMLPGALARGVARLQKTRFFRVTNVRCQPLGGQGRLSVTVQGNSIVRRVRFSGNQALFTRELRNKVQLQPGDVLNPDTKASAALLAQQKRALLTAYSREGFDDVSISVRTDVIGVGQVEVRFTVKEGQRKRVTERALVVEDPHRPTERERRAGLVCATVRERGLLKESGLQEVDVFTRRASVRARGRIRQRLRALGYGNSRVHIRHDALDQRVQVRVKLGKCSLLRLKVRETPTASANGGWKVSDDESLLAVLPFSQSGVFDVDEAERGRRGLLAALNNRGYLFAQVSMDVRDIPKSWNSRVVRAISYSVTTGYQAQIRGMHVQGARHFSPTQLREMMRTKPYDLFDDGGYLRPALMFADLDALRRRYQDEGYFDFRYALTSGQGLQSLTGVERRAFETQGERVIEMTSRTSGFRIRQPVGEPFIYVDVPIQEGKQTRLSGLSVTGPTEAQQRSRALELLGMRSGDVVSHTKLNKGLERIRDWYSDHGYFQARVRAYCKVQGASTASLTAPERIAVDPCLQPIPPTTARCQRSSREEDLCKDRQEVARTGAKRPCRPDDWCACTPKRILAQSVEVKVRVDEGERVRFGDVFVSGNFLTESDVLTRHLPAFGSPYSGQALFKALRKIRNLGLFRSVSFRRIGADECPPRKHIALMVQVVEGDHRTLDLDGGFQTANVNRGAGVSQVGEPSPLLVDVLEHLVSANARLNTNLGQRVGARLPQLVLAAGLDYRDRNFWGIGHELRGVARLGVSSNLGDLAQQPFSLGLGALSYTIPRLPYDISLRMVPFISRDFVTTTIDVDKMGGAAELSKRFFDAVSTSLGAEAALVSYRDATTLGELTPWRWQFKAIVRANYDATDSPINPTNGLTASGSVALINATIEDPLTKSAINGGFVKIDTQIKWHLTMRRSFTLAMMLRAGYARVLQDLTDGAVKQAVLPANEAYRLGGQLGVRGFTDNGVLQYDAQGKPKPLLLSDGSAVCQDDKEGSPCAQSGAAGLDTGNVMLAGTVEGRFPLLRKLGIWGAVFWDWGGLGGELGDLGRSTTYRHSVGVGLRFLISGQIPLRLDYGLPLERRCAVPLNAGGGCAVQEEIGQLQAGLLYAF